MRPWLVMPIMCVASSVAADTSVSDSVAKRWVPCVTALRTALLASYPASPQSTDEHYCVQTDSATGVTFDCAGACLDRNCHNDGCTLSDRGLKVSIETRRGDPTRWSRTPQNHTEVVWERQYGAIRAQLVQSVWKGQKSVTVGELWRVRRTLDACFAERTDFRSP